MDNKLFDIAYWRNEFTIEKKRIGKGWRKLLIGNQPFYDTYKGGLMLEQVSVGRASLTRTVQVVNDMKNLNPAEKPQKSSLREAAIAQSLKNLERPAERILKDGKARREKIQADYQARIEGRRKKQKVNQ